MIKAYKCVPVVQELYCDDCEVKMERQSVTYTSNPIQFEYKCPKCGKTIMSTETYPQIGYTDFEEIKNFAVVEN
ncbi:hypothetical protein [uncultured Clostridium sp.]|uniref:hypothetical protein n=1 Tax=uncultured Clostridium sp. TaxID=59620 RepID=UPI0026385316|nr:hypothetical protein [uncultured Clostridium sp.]